MSRLIFIFLLFVISLIRIPLSVLVIIFKNVIPSLQRRVLFERANLRAIECRSFKKDYIIADYCFEVASEGELEQIRPLLDSFLQKQKRIEILFASPSVESKCLKLALDYPDQVRVLRLPLVSFMPFDLLYFQSTWTWVSAPKILFCRYDFYPELLAFRFLGKKLILLSAAGKKPSWYKEKAYEFFCLIVAATKSEEAYFLKLYPQKKVYSFDFRVPRIFERLSHSEEVLNRSTFMASYNDSLKLLGNDRKIILGSAWPSDMQILHNDKLQDDLCSGELHLLIVPHTLGHESIGLLLSKLREVLPKVPVYELSKDKVIDGAWLLANPGIVLLNAGGVLCELYNQFHFSYVGGGYERSIHSVLEPFLSGSMVITGPLVQRSTEYDLVQECAPKEIHLLKNPESFYNLVNTIKTKTPDQLIRRHLKDQSRTLMGTIINEIESC